MHVSPTPCSVYSMLLLSDSGILITLTDCDVKQVHLLHGDQQSRLCNNPTLTIHPNNICIFHPIMNIKYVVD
jgi:hypothetical protein